MLFYFNTNVCRCKSQVERKLCHIFEKSFNAHVKVGLKGWNYVVALHSARRTINDCFKWYFLIFLNKDLHLSIQKSLKWIFFHSIRFVMIQIYVNRMAWDQKSKLHVVMLTIQAPKFCCFIFNLLSGTKFYNPFSHQSSIYHITIHNTYLVAVCATYYILIFCSNSHSITCCSFNFRSSIVTSKFEFKKIVL